MSIDRGFRREGRGCIRARRRRSTATHGETEDGSEDASRTKRLGAGLALVLGHGVPYGYGVELGLPCVLGKEVGEISANHGRLWRDGWLPRAMLVARAGNGQRGGL